MIEKSDPNGSRLNAITFFLLNVPESIDKTVFNIKTTHDIDYQHPLGRNHEKKRRDADKRNKSYLYAMYLFWTTVGRYIIRFFTPSPELFVSRCLLADER